MLNAAASNFEQVANQRIGPAARAPRHPRRKPVRPDPRPEEPGVPAAAGVLRALPAQTDSAGDEAAMASRPSVRRRDALVEQHLPLAYRLASKTFRTLGRTVELDELISLATEGLLHAASRYDAAAGASFSTFAYYRIRGAIYDGLRRMGPVSAATYRRLRLAEASSCTTQPGDGARGDQSPRWVGLEGTASLRTRFDAEGRSHPHGEMATGEDVQVNRELRDQLERAVAGLPDRERALIRSYYHEDNTLLEAGRKLGISKSWACRLHGQAIRRLRQSLTELVGE